VQARREQIYEMYLKGSCEQEIAQAMGVNQSTVSRALDSIRKRNLEWYDGNHDKEGYLGSLLKEHIDRVRGLLREAWLLYHKVSEMDMGRRIQALSLVKNTMTYQGQMLGLKLPSLPESEELNDINEIKEKLKELEETKTTEKNLPI
jgi:DNA-binding MarR family transcriptional regulator